MRTSQASAEIPIMSQSESAGAGSVTTLPLIEGSHKYIRRVIAQSGGPSITVSTEDAIACTNEVMEILGCKTVADLNKVDAEKLLEASAVTGHWS